MNPHTRNEPSRVNWPPRFSLRRDPNDENKFNFMESVLMGKASAG